MIPGFLAPVVLNIIGTTLSNYIRRDNTPVDPAVANKVTTDVIKELQTNPQLRDQLLNYGKSFFQSKTVIAALVGVIASAVGITLEAQQAEQMYTMISQGVALVSGLLAAYFRKTATQPIK